MEGTAEYPDEYDNNDTGVADAKPWPEDSAGWSDEDQPGTAGVAQPPDESAFEPAQEVDVDTRSVAQGRALWLPRVIRAGGLDVEVVEGWETRGRPTLSGNGRPKYVVNHHTGGKDTGARSSLNWCVRQSPIAPLCQLFVTRDISKQTRPKVVVVASGRANHAGEGDYPDGVRNNNGHSLGIEVQNTGSNPWTPAQYELLVALNAILLGALGRSPSEATTHREYAPRRKTDPNFGPGKNLSKFRDDIRRWGGGGRTYTVRAGDTLWRIAAQQLGDGNRWQEIAALNGIRPPHTIRVGQQLKLP